MKDNLISFRLKNAIVLFTIMLCYCNTGHASTFNPLAMQLTHVIDDNTIINVQQDQNGNIIFDNNENHLIYGSNDELVKIIQKDGAIIHYHYSAMGQQIKQIVNNAEPLYHYYNHGAINGDLQNGNLNYYSEAALLRINPSGIQKRFYVKDNLGSTISLIDHHNKLQHYYRYLPFGFESDALAHDPKPFDVFDLDSSSKTYNGILSDHTSGLQFLGNGYRAYNPQLRQFMQQDSLSPFDAGGINGYTYSDNNPIMAFDPSGHSSVWQKIWGHGGSTIFGTLAPIALMPLAGPLAFVIPSAAFGAVTASIATDSINNATYHQNWQQQMKSTGWKNAVIAAGSAEATGIVSSGTGALLSPAIAGTTGAIVASAAAGAITQAATSQGLAMALGAQQGFNTNSFLTNAAIGTVTGAAMGIVQTLPVSMIGTFRLSEFNNNSLESFDIDLGRNKLTLIDENGTVHNITRENVTQLDLNDIYKKIANQSSFASVVKEVVAQWGIANGSQTQKVCYEINLQNKTVTGTFHDTWTTKNSANLDIIELKHPAAVQYGFTANLTTETITWHASIDNHFFR
ncbi:MULTISPECIES: RHS repeat domain-containing protein [Cysteiniphilum]|uniref:RHS repeat-associated core domain-containing protein n=1 Tax=Cysteiniphilum litorale TaxID=2056700 RepID=A0A8J2Z4Y8_9GAMM|nr:MULTISPECIES: RHS repeat-associated core domain-containing protein [Cysteiniphilum]GGF99815.1 hypothetical protein GCM10010995_16380 [Cysteiniphilum litorale]